MQTPLLKTKLYIPANRSGLVPRPRLVERLDEGLRSRKLTLVSAPAGFGKTTLLGEWIHGRGEVAADEAPTPLRFAWLSLDAEDNDPARFWSYFIAALQTIHPDLGQSALTALQARQPESLPVELLLTGLINEIVDLTDRWALVLDDLHLITSPRVHQGLAFLIDHLPDRPPPLAGGLHVVLSGRADPPWPLARYRARGEIAELRAGDLRFTPQEASSFLNEVVGLGLSAQDVSALETRTEGWIAGLQLAALASQDHPDRTAFVRAFSGSHRLIVDYLMQEVLDRQPAAVQAFLLQTSVLERMTAALCDALIDELGRGETTRPAGSQEVLEHLEQTNLFVVPLDDERRWYRYHHLFADLLRRRLQADPVRTRAAHRAASAWFEENHWTGEAISHALAAQDHDRAAELIEAQVTGVLARGEFGPMRRWLEALPEAQIRASALLSVARAWTVRESAPVETVEAWLRQAESVLDAASLPVDGERRGDGEQSAPDSAGVVRANAAFIRVLDARRHGGSLETQLSLLKQAEQVVPDSDLAMRCSIAAWQGLCYMDRGDEVAAERAFVKAWQIGQAGRGHWAVLVAVYGRTIMARWHGKLQHAAALCREALAAVGPAANAPSAGLAYGSDLQILLGRVLLEWNELEGAQDCLDKGLTGRAPGGVNEIAVLGQYERARLQLARGQAGEIPDLRRLVPPVVRPLIALADALEAHLCLMSAARAPGHPQAKVWWQRATRWAASCSLAPDGEHWPTIERLVCARVQVARSCAGEFDDLRPVLDFLDAQGALLETRDWIELLVQTWIVKATALLAAGQEADALDALGHALALAAPGGYRRVFLDEGAPMARLLALAAEQGIRAAAPLLAHTQETAPSFALADPLSARELDVLRMLDGDLSRPEIARALYLSANTVRSHVQHIYDKLDVHSRQDAVQRARELGLL